MATAKTVLKDLYRTQELEWNTKVTALRSELDKAEIRREYYRIRLAQINQGTVVLEAAQ